MGTKDEEDAWPNPNDPPKAPAPRSTAPPPTVVHVVHHHPPPVYYYPVPGPRKKGGGVRLFFFVLGIVAIGVAGLAFLYYWNKEVERSDRRRDCADRGIRSPNSPSYGEIKRRCESDEYSFPGS